MLVFVALAYRRDHLFGTETQIYGMRGSIPLKLHLASGFGRAMVTFARNGEVP